MVPLFCHNLSVTFVLPPPRQSGGTGILRKLSLCYSIVYYYGVHKGTINQSINQKRIKVTKVTNVTERPLYEQFLQVGRLQWALILLGLALLSSEYGAPLYIHSKFFWLHLFSTFSELSLVGLALDLVD